MKVGVVVFPGSNCDADAYHVFKNLIGVETVYLWHKDKDLQGVDFIFLPGGFSYGDYLRSGAIARFSPIMSEVVEFAKNGGAVLGVCNGFQVLTEVGLLPGALTKNSGLKFICDNVQIEATNTNSMFTSRYNKGEIITGEVAHIDGRYFIDEDGLKSLYDEDRVVFKYLSNINGSIDNIAGIINKEGNVLGMMPHPERCSEKLLGHDEGLKIFESIYQHFA